MFTQPCFIRKARKELAFNVAALGYTAMYMVFRNNIEGNHLVLEGGTWHFTDSDNHPHCIDCGTNENLFLAIAALRNDTDRDQWFVHKSGHHWWKTEFDSFEKCFYETNDDHGLKLEDFHKATVQELIEHFSKKEEEP